MTDKKPASWREELSKGMTGLCKNNASHYEMMAWVNGLLVRETEKERTKAKREGAIYGVDSCHEYLIKNGLIDNGDHDSEEIKKLKKLQNSET